MESEKQSRPVCEECDLEMHQFATQEGDYFVCGWGCDGCGWSFDTYRERDAVVIE